MNRAHAPMTNWALAQIPISDCHSVLDIGCGGGAAILRIANLLPKAEIYGVDYSPESLRIATQTCRPMIAAKRVFLHQASVSQLPFQNQRFDLAFANEAHYFWPRLEDDLREIRRILRSRGAVMIAGGVYFGGRHDWLARKVAAAGGLNCQTLPELSAILREAGFGDVVVHEERRNSWFCVAGRKPTE